MWTSSGSTNSTGSNNFRVGGVGDVSYGQQLNRDNWRVSGEHTWMISDHEFNELRAQYGSHKYEEPANSHQVTEWFSGGNTLMTGTNILGDLLGKGTQWEVLDTWHWQMGGRGVHDIKAGLSAMGLPECSRDPDLPGGTVRSYA